VSVSKLEFHVIQIVNAITARISKDVKREEIFWSIRPSSMLNNSKIRYSLDSNHLAKLLQI
jgi:hypothetical protein